MPDSFSQFNESLQAHKDWEEKKEAEKNMRRCQEITALAEGETDSELLEAIEEMEPESATELARRIDSVIHWAGNELKELETRDPSNN